LGGFGAAVSSIHVKAHPLVKCAVDNGQFDGLLVVIFPREIRRHPHGGFAPVAEPARLPWLRPYANLRISMGAREIDALAQIRERGDCRQEYGGRRARCPPAPPSASP